MCENPAKIGIIKNINMPLMVINWCAIKAKDESTNDNKIKKSLLFKNL